MTVSALSCVSKCKMSKISENEKYPISAQERPQSFKSTVNARQIHKSISLESECSISKDLEKVSFSVKFKEPQNNFEKKVHLRKNSETKGKVLSIPMLEVSSTLLD